METINTIRGPMNPALLVKVENVRDDERERTVETEWRDLAGLVVRRDVHVHLKTPLNIGALTGRFG